MMKNKFLTNAIPALSPLEAQVISLMQPQAKYSAADLYTIVCRQRKVAASSVSVILDRLYQKGLVARETETARGGIRFRYSLETNKERFERKVVESTVNTLVKKFGSKAIAYFNETFSSLDKK